MSAQNNEQRDDQGRFTKGNSGGPGNPFARQIGKLRKVILDALTEDEMLAITQKLIDLAKEGNTQAARLLLSYSLGKPTEGVQPDQLDVGEWDIQKKTAVMAVELRDLATKPEASFSLDLVRTIRSGMNKEMGKVFLEGLEEVDEDYQRQLKKKKKKGGKTRQACSPSAPSPNGVFDQLLSVIPNGHTEQS